MYSLPTFLALPLPFPSCSLHHHHHQQQQAAFSNPPRITTKFSFPADNLLQPLPPITIRQPPLQRLQHQRASPPAPVTDACHAQLALLLPQHAQQRRHDPRPAATERVPERDGAPVQIDLFLAQVQQLQVCERDDRERLVDLERVDVGDIDAGVLEGFRDGERGRGGKLRGRLRGVAPAKDAGEGSEGVGFQEGFRDDEDGGGAIGKGGGVWGGDGAGAVGYECWFDGLEFFDIERGLEFLV